MSMHLGNQAQRADINVTPLIDVELRPFGLQSNCCHQTQCLRDQQTSAGGAE